MKKKSISLNKKLMLNKNRVTVLNNQQQMLVNGGQTQAVDTCISSQPPSVFPTCAPRTLPCGQFVCVTP